jgi:hypothetical protein
LPGGGQYGPADESLLKQWIREDRVDAESLVWRDDWSEWRRAGDVFAELDRPKTATFPAFVDIPDLAQITGKGPSVGAKSAIEPTRRAGRRGHSPKRQDPNGRSLRLGKEGSKRLVAILSLMVIVLAVALVFVVVYFGQD